ncbi:MAG: hypothetical protein J6Z82_10120, partial [Schwartzia sp.]|nr:hypothetical protein [Schwartzia sp. (in: firmicutes)]
MWKKLMSAILIAALAVMTAACGGGGGSSGGGSGAPKKETKVDRSKEFVTVLTGPTSGIYFPIGGAFSKVIGEMGYKTSAT